MRRLAFAAARAAGASLRAKLCFAMKLANLASVLVLAACGEAGVTIVGTIADVRGQCHHIIGDDGQRYAVKAGALGTLRPEQRVRIRGEIAPVSDCAGAKLIQAKKVEPL